MRFGFGFLRRSGPTPEAIAVTRRLLSDALERGAQEIFVDPTESGYEAYFRRLGDSGTPHTGGTGEYGAIRTTLESWSGGGDGVFRFKSGVSRVPIRVLTYPLPRDGRIFVRFLDHFGSTPELDELGISALAEWRKGLQRKGSLCLACGHTGSGRSTTLLASMRAIGTDPRKRGDIEVVGEIRDTHVALAAVKAANAGKLVLGTMCAGSIHRVMEFLRDLEIPQADLRSALGPVLVQTLVKARCTSCEGAGRTGDVSCSPCHGTGYDRRTTVSECHAFTPAAVDAAFANVALRRDRPTKPAWTCIIDDGIDKMLSGTVDAEVLRREFGPEFDQRCAERGIDPSIYPRWRGLSS